MALIQVTQVTPVDQVELSAVQILPDGEGFMLEVRSADQPPLQLRFPVWTLHQLMRVLPRIDAALHQSRQRVSAALLAYPVDDWTVEYAGPDRGITLCIRTDRNIDSGYTFAFDAALVLHRELGEAIAQAQATAASEVVAPVLN